MKKKKINLLDTAPLPSITHKSLVNAYFLILLNKKEDLLVSRAEKLRDFTIFKQMIVERSF